MTRQIDPNAGQAPIGDRTGGDRHGSQVFSAPMASVAAPTRYPMTAGGGAQSGHGRRQAILPTAPIAIAW